MIRRYVEDAETRVRLAVSKLASGSETLERVANELEIESRIWGQRLHDAVLNDLSLEGVAPEEFEKRAAESAHEIAAIAAAKFSVQCSRGAQTPITPLLIGENPGVVNTGHAIDVDTRLAIRNYLEAALAKCPGQYHRQNLSVYKLNRGIRGGGRGAADTAGVSRMPLESVGATTLDPQPVNPEVETASGELGSVRKSPKEFVDAARRKSRLRSYEKFASRIGVGKDTLYAITKESRWVSDATYLLVSQVCTCEPPDLHPRDLLRPPSRS